MDNSANALLEFNLPVEFLKCFICTKKYTNATQLSGCLHSFCRECLPVDEDGLITCPRCSNQGTFHNDKLIASLTTLSLDDRKEPITCDLHDGNNRNLFCQTCKIVLCSECPCNTNLSCNVFQLTDENCESLNQILQTNLTGEMTKAVIDINDAYECKKERQGQLIREKCQTSTKVSTLFHNVKAKLLEHLSDKEKALQDKLTQFYEDEEKRLSTETKRSQAVKERLENDQELLNSSLLLQGNMSYIGVIDSVKQDLNVCRSLTDEGAHDKNVSVEFSIRLSDVNKMFELKPADLKMTGGQDEATDDNVIVQHVSQEDLLTYTISRTPSGRNIPSSLDNGESQDRNGANADDRTSIRPGNQSFIDNDHSESYSDTATVPSYDQLQPRANPASNTFFDSHSADGGYSRPLTPNEYAVPTAPELPPGESFSINSIQDPRILDNSNIYHYYGYGDCSRQFKNRYANETKEGKLIGMTWIDNGRILMVDRLNNKLKLVAQNGVLLSTRVLPEGVPWDIAYVRSQNQSQKICAVTLPRSRRILFVHVTEMLAIFKQITTRTGYCSIAHDKSGHSLVCGCLPSLHPPAVHMIDSNGAVTREFYLDSLGQKLFDYPGSIDVTDDGQIVVCDWKKHQLVVMRTDGFIYGAYRGSPSNPLVDSVGTTLDDLGNVFVTDSQTSKIHIMSLANRQFIGTLLTDVPINQPTEINFDGSKENYPKVAITSGTDVFVLDLRRS